MYLVTAAKSAKLLQFQPLGFGLLVFSLAVVLVLTVGALQSDNFAHVVLSYSKISVTVPAPTVRPPSRIANRNPLSIATGVISSTTRLTLSPGITISVPAGNSATPVTSVVRK